MFAHIHYTIGKTMIVLTDGWLETTWQAPKSSKSYPGSFADAGHVYVHMRNGIIGEQVGGRGCDVMGDGGCC